MYSGILSKVRIPLKGCLRLAVKRPRPGSAAELTESGICRPVPTAVVSARLHDAWGLLYI